MALLAELWEFLAEKKKLWMVPLLLLLLVFGGMLLLAQGSAIAPFIYTVF
jgi:Family of unknown function (DUF5989)